MLCTVIFLTSLFCSLHAYALKLAVVFPDRKHKLGTEGQTVQWELGLPRACQRQCFVSMQAQSQVPRALVCHLGMCGAHYKAAFNTNLETKSIKKGNEWHDTSIEQCQLPSGQLQPSSSGKGWEPELSSAELLLPGALRHRHSHPRLTLDSKLGAGSWICFFGEFGAAFSVVLLKLSLFAFYLLNSYIYTLNLIYFPKAL